MADTVPTPDTNSDPRALSSANHNDVNPITQAADDMTTSRTQAVQLVQSTRAIGVRVVQMTQEARPGSDGEYIIPAPDQAFVDPRDPAMCVLGEGLHADGQWAPVGLPWVALQQPLHITGSPASAPRALLQNLMLQRISQGHGGLLLDSQGTELVSSLLTRIPHNREADVTILDVGTTITVTGEDLHIPFNLLAPSVGRDRGITIPAHAGVFEAWASSVVSHVEHPQWLRPCLYMAEHAILAGEHHPTVAHLARFFRDNAYREQVCLPLPSSDVRSFWLDRAPLLPEVQATLMSLGSRFEELIQNPALADLFAEPDCVADVREELDQHRIVLVQVAVPSAYRTLALTQVLTQLVLAAFARADIPDNDRPHWQILIADAHLALPLASGLSSTVLTRLGKAGVGIAFGHHELSQLSGVAEHTQAVPASDIFGAAVMSLSIGEYARNRAILGANEQDAATYARTYHHLGLTEDDFPPMERDRGQFLKLTGCGHLFPSRPVPAPGLESLDAPRLAGASHDWRTIRALAADSQDSVSDALIAEVAVLAQTDRAAAVSWLGHMCRNRPELFQQYRARTRAHRLAQRGFILAHPGSIADPSLRIQIVSALRIAVPVLETQAARWSTGTSTEE